MGILDITFSVAAVPLYLLYAPIKLRKKLKKDDCGQIMSGLVMLVSVPICILLALLVLPISILSGFVYVCITLTLLAIMGAAMD